MYPYKCKPSRYDEDVLHKKCQACREQARLAKERRVREEADRRAEVQRERENRPREKRPSRYAAQDVEDPSLRGTKRTYSQDMDELDDFLTEFARGRRRRASQLEFTYKRKRLSDDHSEGVEYEWYSKKRYQDKDDRFDYYD